MKSTDSVIVSWDFSHGKDAGVLIERTIYNAYSPGCTYNNYEWKNPYLLYNGNLLDMGLCW